LTKLDEDLGERLFSYGTLREESVQRATFGRKLEGEADSLMGYSLRMIQILDEAFVATSGTADHRNLVFTGQTSDCVDGVVFKVTKTELDLADAYEPVGYKRVQVQLKSGATAWVYLNVRR
jgi:gamma-glutamylcyclotransferase (GGCT)/AIG2-like uncharacterized protein YtfP